MPPRFSRFRLGGWPQIRLWPLMQDHTSCVLILTSSLRMPPQGERIEQAISCGRHRGPDPLMSRGHPLPASRAIMGPSAPELALERPVTAWQRDLAELSVLHVA